ncbi:MAG: hypothetical protein QF579_02845 [Dehalococcoidia bacterium]|nr:hypothetical protein [Dehalococcoidia bacterium]
MTLSEGGLLLIHWFHSLSAVTWVGGSLFYVLVLRPQQRKTGPNGTMLGPEALSQFRGLVDACIAVLILTGTILLFDRITSPSTSSAYLITVSVKIMLALWMFAVARRRWQRQRSQSASSPTARLGRLNRVMDLMSGVNLTVILGIVVFFVSDLLAFIYQGGLTGR